VLRSLPEWARGFVPLEEFPDLWPGNPALLLVKRI
jgi:hypothetical protein